MIVVSNTSPLNYLILIEKIDILPQLFGRVVVPRRVTQELSHPRAPTAVQSWIANPPSWIEIRVPTKRDPAIRLGAGETDALNLAIELKADLVLVDERRARQVAGERGLTVTGVLGVLKLGADRGLLDISSSIEALRRTSYRIADELVQRLLGHGKEQGRQPRPDSDKGRAR